MVIVKEAETLSVFGFLSHKEMENEGAILLTGNFKQKTRWNYAFLKCFRIKIDIN